jgi:hypothetical protein
VVLQAAVDIDNGSTGLSELSPNDVTTGADKLETDGGTATIADDSDACPNGEARCDGLHGEAFPCFDCFEVEQ